MGISIVGLIACMVVVFLVMKWGQSSAEKTEGAKPESNGKLAWVAIISVLALLGFLMAAGAFNTPS